MSVSRNEPCPCGSGEKYKRCCIDKPGEPGAEAGRRGLLWAILAVAVVIAVGVGAWKGMETGLAVAGGGVLLVGAIAMIRNPPPPKANPGDPAGMNFGN